MSDRPALRRLTFTRSSRAYRLLLLHPVRLIRRLLSEHASPRGLGVAAAVGIVIGALPFLGLHTLLVYVAASRLRLNRLVALGTNQLCMPPVVPALCIEAGFYLRHGSFLTEISFRTLGNEALERFWEWLLGSFVVGPVLALVVGLGVWLLAEFLQRRMPPPEVGSFPASAAVKGGEATPAGQP